MNRTDQAWRIFLQVATVFSFTINTVLLGVLLRLTPLMSKANIDLDNPRGPTIHLTVRLDGALELDYDIPVEQNTVVALTSSVPMNLPARFELPGQGGTIDGTVSLSLPAGLRLPLSVNTVMPVEVAVPVYLDGPITVTLSEQN